MGKLVDLVGQKFGRLIVIERADETTRCGHAKWLCQCECGKTFVAASNNLRFGNTTSCGCLQSEIASEIGKANTKHGQSRTRLYKVWCGMIGRCYDPGKAYYKYYGGRGITVCAEWRKDFEAFSDWAMKNGYDPTAGRGECTIDRINTDGNYCPDNCRWVTMREQNTNRRNSKKDVRPDGICAR